VTTAGSGIPTVLTCGTTLERIKPESLTQVLSEFVHAYISG
jgi:hypothetical protein